MALFSRKTTTKETTDNKPKASGVNQSKVTDRDLAAVIIKPRVTEKAVKQSERNVYTFNVRRDATKYDVRDAVIHLFKVTPVKVNIVNKAPKTSMSRAKGRKVSEKGLKKAYVYLKDGDSINLV